MYSAVGPYEYWRSYLIIFIEWKCIALLRFMSWSQSCGTPSQSCLWLSAAVPLCSMCQSPACDICSALLWEDNTFNTQPLIMLHWSEIITIIIYSLLKSCSVLESENLLHLKPAAFSTQSSWYTSLKFLNARVSYALFQSQNLGFVRDVLGNMVGYNKESK